MSHDLAAGFIGAETWSETRDIDFGTPRGRRHLLDGWSDDWWDDRRNRAFVAGEGEQSSLWFELRRPRPMVMQFFIGPLDTGTASGVDLSVNGYPVGSLELGGRPRRYRIAVQEGVLQPGRNELVARYAGADPATSSFAVAWYRVGFLFEENVEPPLPTRLDDGDSLRFPYGTWAEYVVELPAASALTIDRVELLGEGGGSLSLIVEEDAQPARRYGLDSGAGGRVELDLSADRRRIVRLTLRADGSAGGEGAVVLEKPVLRTPRQAERVDRVTAAGTRQQPASQALPNVLLYVVDTLRADRLGIYGHAGGVSPELDRFAADATVFENSIGQSSWTRASMASIFTGLWPLKHAANGRKDILDPEATTMAEIFDQLGYETVARVRNWNVFPVFGFRQGFEDFTRVREGKADRLTWMARRWLEEREDDRPFFLWLHTVDPHEPYRPPAETLARFMPEDQADWGLDKHPGFKQTAKMSEAERQSVSRYLLALYDAEIAFNDQAFGQLVTLLRERGLLDSTVIIFASDHGEEFQEHGSWGHGRNLHAANLNVPLVVRFPDRGHGQRVSAVVQHIDLLPTLLDYVGQPVPVWVEGRSFLPLLDGRASPGSEEWAPAFSFLHLDGAPTRSLVDGDWKLIQRLDDEGEVTWQGLFHRREDPKETINRMTEFPIRTGFMAAKLDAKMAEGSLLSTEEAVLDEETTRALKALGYLQ